MQKYTKNPFLWAPAILPAISFKNTPTVDDGFNFVATIVNRGMYWLATFAFLIAGVMIIVAGIKFMIAGGDEEKRKSAKHTLIFALVGVVVVILAQNFISVIKNFFGA